MILAKRLTRREANRAATHTAIVDAAYALAAENPVDRITVDAIAERAQISRRTFFNYFPSLEAALADPVSEMLAAALTALDERPVDEPLLDAIEAVFAAAFTPDRLPRLAQQFEISAGNPQALRFHLERWHRAQDEIADALTARQPGTDPLLAQTVAAAALGVLERIVALWLRSCCEQGTDAAQHLDALHDDVRRAFTYLADGLRDPLRPRS